MVHLAGGMVSIPAVQLQQRHAQRLRLQGNDHVVTSGAVHTTRHRALHMRAWPDA